MPYDFSGISPVQFLSGEFQRHLEPWIRQDTHAAGPRLVKSSGRGSEVSNSIRQRCNTSRENRSRNKIFQVRSLLSYKAMYIKR